ncbi:ammonium transporter, partial [Pseudomonas aeruginosa]|nr:ammonium transporter [Pseudomonas aeruginosa]
LSRRQRQMCIRDRLMKALLGIRLSQEEEYYGADLSIHKIGAISHE